MKHAKPISPSPRSMLLLRSMDGRRIVALPTKEKRERITTEAMDEGDAVSRLIGE